MVEGAIQIYSSIWIGQPTGTLEKPYISRLR
jgi:hypothetical protein